MFTSDQDDDAKTTRNIVNIHRYSRGKIHPIVCQYILFYIPVLVSLRDLILSRGPDDDAQGSRGGRGQGPDGPGHLHLHPRLLSCHLHPLLPPETVLLLAARQLIQGEFRDEMSIFSFQSCQVDVLDGVSEKKNIKRKSLKTKKIKNKDTKVDMMPKTFTSPTNDAILMYEKSDLKSSKEPEKLPEKRTEKWMDCYVPFE